MAATKPMKPLCWLSLLKVLLIGTIHLISPDHVVTAFAASPSVPSSSSSASSLSRMISSNRRLGRQIISRHRHQPLENFANPNSQESSAHVLNYIKLKTGLRPTASATVASIRHPRTSSITSSIITNGQRRTSLTTMNLIRNIPRGGAVASLGTGSPQSVFNTSLLGLALVTVASKILQKLNKGSSASKQAAIDDDAKPAEVKSLQRRFLAVFWLLRCADWLQGPYFYQVYASKVINGASASMQLISRLFLTGFASTAVFGPSVGRAADQYGRKRATVAFSIIYAMGALSTKSNVLQILFLGRLLSGIGTSLLFSAPESWLVGASQSSGNDPDGKYLGETFGMAYAGDSVVAILAGQMAGLIASQRGPTGPFELSTIFLAIGGALAAFSWKENKAESSSGDAGSNKKPSIKDAIDVVKNDPKIMLVGGAQSLFEAAMYIFVLQWPPAMSSAVSKVFGPDSATPYGTIFSCFMASCLLGSTIFGSLVEKGVPAETFTTAMLSVATLAMTSATWTVSSAAPKSLAALAVAFFAFEACVGMYFPSIGTLRSKYVPDSHRSVIMNLFGIPLNVLVVGVFLSISKLGVGGALGISSAALGVATLCMITLQRMIKKEEQKEKS